MRKLMVAVGSTLVLAAPLAHADVLGLGASVSYWKSEVTGQAANKNSVIDVENDLDLERDSNANASLYFEHPVPVLPNVRLSYTSIQQSGQSELSTNYDVFNDVAGSGVDVRSELDLDELDLTLYYEVLDNWANLDLGLTARDMSGELVVRESGGAQRVSRTEIDAVIPMGYAAVRFDLPMTGVSLGAEGNFISYSGDSVHDVNAYGQYEIAALQLRAGYRQMAIDYEDSDDRLDIEIGGPFVSAGVAF
ncbi:TIGR04219 family outer membrane beta-barrel protein [Marinobacter sp.]|uniref:TIGR04219 family outer membrane beta-barrel protein n=1 Tax=Marinobacter sp. TaxID=50741 RepID=UPI0035C7541C|nr:TIGR04219 family outer membrane beta-barrel protein [Oleiphilaceae bacterium]